MYGTRLAEHPPKAFVLSGQQDLGLGHGLADLARYIAVRANGMATHVVSTQRDVRCGRKRGRILKTNELMSG